LANLVQFKRMLIFCLEDWRPATPPCLRHWAIIFSIQTVSHAWFLCASELNCQVARGYNRTSEQPSNRLHSTLRLVLPTVDL